MRRFAKSLLVLGIAAVSLLSAPITAVQACYNPFGSINGSLKTFLQPSAQYHWHQASMRIEGVAKSTLFDFLSDDRNDVYWWPGVVSCEIAEGDGRAGTIYNEYIQYGDTTFLNPIRIDAWMNNWYEVQETIGPVKSWALITFKKEGSAVVFTTYAFLPYSPLIDDATVKAQLEVGYQNIANHFNTTQTTSYVGGVLTTDANGGFDSPFDTWLIR